MLHGPVENARPTTMSGGAARRFGGRGVTATSDAPAPGGDRASFPPRPAPPPSRKNLTPLRGILLGVKKVVVLTSLALFFLALRNLDVGLIPAARRAALPFKVALLAARGPDAELAVPV